MNSVLSPIVQGVHGILEEQTFDMNEYREQKDKLEYEALMRNPETAYLASDEEFDRQLDELGWSPSDLVTMTGMYMDRAAYNIKKSVRDWFRELLELMFAAAALIIDTLRTFFLVVLSILGPIAFAFSVWDGFHSTLSAWFSRYIQIYLWLPVSDLFSTILAKIQILMLRQDIERMQTDPNFSLDASDGVYIVFLIIGGIGLVLVLLLGLLQSCSSMFGGGVSNIVASSYLSEDADLLAAEAAYCAKEDELRRYLDTYEQTHDYDEYHYDLDDIEHDPYVLLSILSALHEGTFTIDQVQGDLQMLFDKQYILTETVEVERRYYIETDTWTDEEGNTHTESYRVYYDYYICTVKLENFDLSHLPVYMMDQETLSMYAVYMSTLGNRPDLFPSSGYVPKYVTNPPAKYEIPAEYLSDERFATLITEAEKYLGFPYVWGGSSPQTSFDCSGFVSYVLTSSGLCNTGRLGAQGLYNISTPVSEPQPGDLVFFVGTYDTPGVSHVGFYVGDGMLLHCGDPIQYTSLNSNYWQSHLYAYGRPPYN